jgi:hypothetical protein
MRLQYRHYMHMNDNQIREHFKKLRRHPEAAEHIIKVVEAQRHALRVARGTKFQLDKTWREILDPAKYELRLVERMLKYPAGSGDPRIVALTRYREVIATLISHLSLAKRRKGMTPTKLALEVEAKNKGMHWTDWVDDDDRQEVIDLFNAIPHKRGAKRKLPFERTIPKSDWAKRHARLLKRTEKELVMAGVIYNKARLADSDERMEKATRTIAKIKQALAWIREAEEGTDLPPTWSGFYLANYWKEREGAL